MDRERIWKLQNLLEKRKVHTDEILCVESKSRVKEFGTYIYLGFLFPLKFDLSNFIEEKKNKKIVAKENVFLCSKLVSFHSEKT